MWCQSVVSCVFLYHIPSSLVKNNRWCGLCSLADLLGQGGSVALRSACLKVWTALSGWCVAGWCGAVLMSRMLLCCRNSLNFGTCEASYIVWDKCFGSLRVANVLGIFCTVWWNFLKEHSLPPSTWNEHQQLWKTVFPRSVQHSQHVDETRVDVAIPMSVVVLVKVRSGVVGIPGILSQFAQYFYLFLATILHCLHARFSGVSFMELVQHSLLTFLRNNHPVSPEHASFLDWEFSAAFVEK